MAYLLLAYLGVFLGATFAAPIYIVWRRTGVNPYALRNSDSAHDYIGGVLRITLALIALSVAANLAPREWYRILAPITWLLTVAQIAKLFVDGNSNIDTMV